MSSLLLRASDTHAAAAASIESRVRRIERREGDAIAIELTLFAGGAKIDFAAHGAFATKRISLGGEPALEILLTGGQLRPSAASDGEKRDGDEERGGEGGQQLSHPLGVTSWDLSGKRERTQQRAPRRGYFAGIVSFRNKSGR